MLRQDNFALRALLTRLRRNEMRRSLNIAVLCLLLGQQAIGAEVHRHRLRLTHRIVG